MCPSKIREIPMNFVTLMTSWLCNWRMWAVYFLTSCGFTLLQPLGAVTGGNWSISDCTLPHPAWETSVETFQRGAREGSDALFLCPSVTPSVSQPGSCFAGGSVIMDWEESRREPVRWTAQLHHWRCTEEFSKGAVTHRAVALYFYLLKTAARSKWSRSYSVNRLQIRTPEGYYGADLKG